MRDDSMREDRNREIQANRLRHVMKTRLKIFVETFLVLLFGFRCDRSRERSNYVAARKEEDHPNQEASSYPAQTGPRAQGN